MQVRADKFSETIAAVVVGVGQCADPALAVLRAVEGQTRLLAETLVSPRACRIPDDRVTRLAAAEDTTRARILESLRERARAAAPGDILFVYFAGHGVARENSFALVPSDGRADQPDSLISAADLGQSLAGTRARGIFLVADCCGGAAIYENARALFGGLDDKLEFRILLSSSKRGESSWEIEGRGSPFTAALVEALQGHMPGVGQQGEIYFTSLMAHMVSRVAELLEGEYSALPPQHPNFDGSYEKDPLLFVNGDVAIGRLVLRTARYSPEYVRRSVRRAVGGLVVAIAAAVLAYWAWIDQHDFFRLDGENVALYHGYSDFPWPGMPRKLWQLPIYRALLAPDSGLARGQDLRFVKDADAMRTLRRLEPELTTSGRIYLAARTGNPAQARTLARAAFDNADPTTNPAEMLGTYDALGELNEEDRALLESIVRKGDVGPTTAEAFASLMRVDPDRAIAAIKDSPAADSSGVLLGIRDAQPPCSQNLRSFLQTHMLQSEEPFLAELAMNAIQQAGCKEAPVPAFPRAASSHPRTFGYFMRLQSPAARDRLAARTLKAIRDLAGSGWNQGEDAAWAGRAIAELAAAGGGKCDADVIAQTASATPGQQLDVLEWLLDACTGFSYQLVPQVGGYAIEFILLDGEQVKSKVLMDFTDDKQLRDRALDFVQRRDAIANAGFLIDEPISDFARAFSERGATAVDLANATHALQWAVRLKYWSPAIEKLLGDPLQPTPIRKWALFAALRAVPETGVAMLLKRFDDFVFDFEGFARVVVTAGLPAGSISELRNFARQRGEHDFFNLVLTSLYGSQDDAAALLLSVHAGDRATAFNFVAFRDDLPQIAAAVAARPSKFDVAMPSDLNNLVAEQKKLDRWLADTPDWALDWRVFVAGRTMGAANGIVLRQFAVINARKPRGIEVPFADGVLRLPSWQ